MQHLAEPSQVAAWSAAAREQGLRIGFVPTMGALHEGHRSLVRRLRPQVDRLVLSIYVNPLQFAPHEDFGAYPRDPTGDAAICEAEGCDLLFQPPELYPPDFRTRIQVPTLDQTLCSVSRPHFFTGVATAVFRLLQIVQPHIACFGEKDYQQLAIIRRMVADLGLPVHIDGGPIIREPDGLALSSRNAYLSPAQRARATSLSRALRAMQAAAHTGERQVAALREIGLHALDVDAVDYLEVVNPHTLQPVQAVHGECRVAVAARIGTTRLIDNAPLGEPT